MLPSVVLDFRKSRGVIAIVIVVIVVIVVALVVVVVLKSRISKIGSLSFRVSFNDIYLYTSVQLPQTYPANGRLSLSLHLSYPQLSHPCYSEGWH